jgi:hypothetical protein
MKPGDAMFTVTDVDNATQTAFNEKEFGVKFEEVRHLQICSI